MIVIATDEAGYGPSLGPLVVAATQWRIPSADVERQSIDSHFAFLSQPIRVPASDHFAGGTIAVDDSKRVHKPKRNAAVNAGHPPRSKLDPLAVLATAAAIQIGDSPANHRALLAHFGVTDSLAKSPQNAAPGSAGGSVADSADASADDSADDSQRQISAMQRDHQYDQPLPLEPAQALADVLRQSPRTAVMTNVAAVAIEPGPFNRSIASGQNKADLLGQTTLDLVLSLLERSDTHPQPACPIEIFCDRLGGRRYYAGLLGHHFPTADLTIVDETTSQSTYRLQWATRPTVTIRYTVRGDSFGPVAYASCIAKYIREAAMRRFNQSFGDRIPGLRPTAGYPVDAQRWLTETQAYRQANQIDDVDLVRCR